MVMIDLSCHVMKCCYHAIKQMVPKILLRNLSSQVKVLVVQSCPTLCNHMGIACQALLSIEFSRQEYCSGLPFPSPGESFWPKDRTQVSCIAGRFFTIWDTREGKFKPLFSLQFHYHQLFCKIFSSFGF